MPYVPTPPPSPKPKSKAKVKPKAPMSSADKAAVKSARARTDAAVNQRFALNASAPKTRKKK